MAIRDHIKPGEIAVLFSFLCAIGLTVALELRWLAHRFLHRLTASPPPFWPCGGAAAQRVLTRGLNMMAVGGLLCVLYGWRIEPGWLEITTTEIRSEKISPASGRVRIAHLSDFHSEREPLNEWRASEMISGLRPDLIVLTGDYINEEAGLPVARKALETLARAAPVYLVTGNFDSGLLPEDAFADLPVAVLRNDTREIEIRGTPLRISGLSFENSGYFPLLARKLAKKKALDLFLHHDPDLADAAARAGMDLYLAGHTHGGQVRLPFYGALMTLSKFGKRFESGLYRVGGMALYVNRGLGMTGERAPRVRFLCRPEITVIDLAPALNP